MNAASFRDWLEVIGIFGVIASLVFVGLQLKQDREIAIASAYQARAGIATEGFAALAANQVTMRTMAKALYGDPDSLIDLEGFAAPITATELQTAIFSVSAMLNLTDNSYYQYQAGFLPEDHWIAVRALLRSLVASSPIWRLRVESRPNNNRPEFNAMIDELLAEIDSESGDGGNRN